MFFSWETDLLYIFIYWGTIYFFKHEILFMCLFHCVFFPFSSSLLKFMLKHENAQTYPHSSSLCFCYTYGYGFITHFGSIWHKNKSRPQEVVKYHLTQKTQATPKMTPTREFILCHNPPHTPYPHPLPPPPAATYLHSCLLHTHLLVASSGMRRAFCIIAVSQ